MPGMSSFTLHLPDLRPGGLLQFMMSAAARRSCWLLQKDVLWQKGVAGTDAVFYDTAEQHKAATPGAAGANIMNQF